MVRRLRQHQRGQGEEGAALALALGFLVLFSTLIAIVISFAGTNILATTQLASQRNTIYTENGGVDAAITRVRNDTSLALGGVGSDCGQQVQTSGGVTVTVACNPQSNSGVPQGSTQAPGFAILSLSPYHGPNPNNGCVNVNNELGVVQVQSKKLLTINGNVYINADIDSDLWSGGCPQITTAQHPLVYGNVIHRESANDLDCAAGYTCAQPVPNPTPAQAALLADPAIANPAAWAPGVDADLTAPPAVQTVPACPAGPVVTFAPGTYTDATAFNALMNGSCANRVFYFAPGNYYFDFTNAGTHEWSINDVTARVVGGQPYNGASSGSVIVGPTTWIPATATNGTTGFTNPNNAKVTDGNPATATISSGQTASIALSAIATTPASTIPSNAVVNSVRVRISHAESATDGDAASVLNRIGSPNIVVASGGTNCASPASFAVTPRVAMGEDAAPSYDVTSCLNTPNKINAGIKVTYNVPHCSGAAPCDATAASVRLDGIAVDITYTLPGRPAWDPTNAATVTASAPLVPGACFHDGDGAAWTNGVQFVFGGDSRVNLRLGKLELCDKPGTTHQEIVLYGVPSGAGSTSVGPVTLAATITANPPSPTTSTPGFGSPLASAATIDGVSSTTGTFSTSAQTEWITTSGYAMSAGQQIPGNATGLTTQLRIVHIETGNSTGFQNLQVFVRDAADANTLCTIPVTRSTSNADVTLAVPANCLTAAMLNTGAFKLRYSVQHNTCSGGGCSLISTALDGLQLKVTYSVPTAGSNLHGGTGCITQTPYYSPVDHTPAYQGACAVLTVSGNPNQIGNDPTTWNVAAMWGTVYVPSAALDIQPYDLQVPVFNRGLVARMAMLGYNPTGNALVPITTTPTVQTIVPNRRMTFTATIPGQSTSVVADIEFCDTTCADPNAQTQSGDLPISIHSWKVTR